MALRWKYETWRKLYVREQGTFAQLPLYARMLAGYLLKLADDKGIIELAGREPADAIAFQAGSDRGDRRLLRKHLPLLFQDGYLVRDGDRLIIRNFVPAQTGHDRVPVERPSDDLEADGGAGGEREPTTNRQRTDHEPATNRPRTGNDAALNGPPSGNDGATMVPRPCHDRATKVESTAENPSTQSGPIPSFLPSFLPDQNKSLSPPPGPTADPRDSGPDDADASHDERQQAAPAKRRRAAAAPRPPADDRADAKTPAVEPPESRNPLVVAFRRGAGDAYVEGVVAKGIAIQLAKLWAECKKRGISESDVEAAGRYAAAQDWRNEPLTPSRLAKGNALFDLLALAKAPHRPKSIKRRDGGLSPEEVRAAAKAFRARGH